MSAQRLTRAGHPDLAAPPVRIVHLGLGAFFRSHQAVYTAQAPDAAGWGIATFSGRSQDLVDRLAAQDGLYTLNVRGPDTDRISVIPSLVAAHPGGDLDALRGRVASPQVEVITLTVTEAAYGPGPHSIGPRLVEALAARRRADAGPVTIVPCDNVPDNASVLAGLLAATARRADPELADWIDESVPVVGTVVDRITPRSTDADVTAAARHGWADIAPVVTEPFSEWILSVPDRSGPLPDWESAGAVRTDDLGPYTRRKLHLLNGAHSLLAYAGRLRGHVSVAEAVTDPVLRAMVEAWWDEAADHVGGPANGRARYRDALVERFANPRMEHRLDQIAVDGSVKLAVRVVPVALAVRRHGGSASNAAAIIGAWIAFVARQGADLVDARATDVHAAVDAGGVDRTRRVLELLSPELAADRDFTDAVTEAAARAAMF